MTSSRPVALGLYRLAGTLLSPLAPAFVRWRADKGKEDPARLGERSGHTDRPRPEGPLIWAHGASIGETQSLLPLVEALTGRGFAVLVTSGTRTSAEILEKRLPAGAFHQYVPLDVPRFVRRFLDQWRPSLVLFAESEVWPTILGEVRRRDVPMVLVNGRLSERSFAGWRRAPAVARAVFGGFSLCLAQDDGDGERLAALGAPVGAVTGNLKFDIASLPADPAQVESLAGRLAGRPVWMAASTHPGEDETVIAAHRAIRQQRPGLLTILAPRHPARAEEIASYAATGGLGVTRRSRREGADDARDLHIVDTVGELGLFYRVSPLVLMGGSLVPHGGQNPIEPVRLGAAVLHGPHVRNFAAVYAALDEAGGALPVDDVAGLAATASGLLRRPGRMRDMARSGMRALDGLGGALPRTLAALAPFLPPTGQDRALR